MSRQKRIPTPAWEHDHGLAGGLSANRLQMYAIGLVVLLVVGAIGLIGFGFLKDYIDDQNRPGSTALKVDDRSYTVRDFTERARMYAAQIGSTNYQFIIPTVSGQLQEEAVVLEYAGEKGVEATDDEVKTEIANLLGITVDDPNFDTRLQEELATTSLSEEEYRDLARGQALRANLIEKFKEELPATLESVRYRQIVVADQATADDLKSQIDDGADFATLATANSTDTTTKDKGGDVGWAPKGYLSESLDSLLFSLQVNQVITYPGSNNVTVYQITETDDARPIDDDKKEPLANRAYSEWLSSKKESAKISDDMDFTNGDVDKIKYVIDHAALTAQ